ncbi:hypothetical protein FHW17_003875 [Phyllobacterium sp. P30BS-XVII]|nr:hypothetical protein [Phyllobacterium sp. P30BS-XVII]
MGLINAGSFVKLAVEQSLLKHRQLCFERMENTFLLGSQSCQEPDPAVILICVG